MEKLLCMSLLVLKIALTIGSTFDQGTMVQSVAEGSDCRCQCVVQATDGNLCPGSTIIHIKHYTVRSVPSGDDCTCRCVAPPPGGCENLANSSPIFNEHFSDIVSALVSIERMISRKTEDGVELKKTVAKLIQVKENILSTAIQSPVSDVQSLEPHQPIVKKSKTPILPSSKSHVLIDNVPMFGKPAPLSSGRSKVVQPPVRVLAVMPASQPKVTQTLGLTGRVFSADGEYYRRTKFLTSSGKVKISFVQPDLIPVNPANSLKERTPQIFFDLPQKTTSRKTVRVLSPISTTTTPASTTIPTTTTTTPATTTRTTTPITTTLPTTTTTATTTTTTATTTTTITPITTTTESTTTAATTTPTTILITTTPTTTTTSLNDYFDKNYDEEYYDTLYYDYDTTSTTVKTTTVGTTTTATQTTTESNKIAIPKLTAVLNELYRDKKKPTVKDKSQMSYDTEYVDYMYDDRSVPGLKNNNIKSGFDVDREHSVAFHNSQPISNMIDRHAPKEKVDTSDIYADYYDDEEDYEDFYENDDSGIFDIAPTTTPTTTTASTTTTPSFLGMCGTMSELNEPDFVYKFGRKEGAWMKDVIFSRNDPARNDKIYLANYYYGNNLLEFDSIDKLKQMRWSKSYMLPDKWIGTGHVVYNGSFYYSQAFTRSLVKYSLKYRFVSAWKHLRDAKYDSSSPFSWRGNSMVRMAADEYGLWVLYPTADPYDPNSPFRYVVHQINPLDLKTIQTFQTNIRSTVSHIFMICGVVYSTDRYNTKTGRITYAYDTKTRSTAPLYLPFDNKYSYNVQMQYNPRDRKIYSWDNGRQILYNVSMTF